jgi:hypothetical protein
MAWLLQAALTVSEQKDEMVSCSWMQSYVVKVVDKQASCRPELIGGMAAGHGVVSVRPHHYAIAAPAGRCPTQVMHSSQEPLLLTCSR